VSSLPYSGVPRGARAVALLTPVLWQVRPRHARQLMAELEGGLVLGNETHGARSIATLESDDGFDYNCVSVEMHKRGIDVTNPNPRTRNRTRSLSVVSSGLASN
jgi:hypothetical protein